MKKSLRSKWTWFIYVVVFVFLSVTRAPPVLFVIFAIAFFYSLFTKRGARMNNITNPATPIPVSPVPVASIISPPSTESLSQLITVSVSAQTAPSSSYSIPQPAYASANSRARWVPKGETIEFAGHVIAGGMLYFGVHPYQNIAPDASLIDPKLSVSNRAQAFNSSDMPYWPSYSEITPKARNTYLNWLANGRCDQSVEIGYVFLYFYGLERRLIVDLASNAADPSVAQEKLLILDELNRLISIYGDKSRSFKMYAIALIDFTHASNIPDKLYLQKLPEIPITYEIPYMLRIALGQAARDGFGINAELAMKWVKHDTRISKRTPVVRCIEQFNIIFPIKFNKAIPYGLVLPVNKTTLKIQYMPASKTLTANRNTSVLNDIPDVSAVIGATKKLQTIVDLCTSDLEPYSRFLGRNPDKASTIDALLLLPLPTWSKSARDILELIGAQVAESNCTTSPIELVSAFDENGTPSKLVLKGIAEALESIDVYMEPDVLILSDSLKHDAPVVLFKSDKTTRESKTYDSYVASKLTIELAVCVACADGDFSEPEVMHLIDNIDTWLHLSLGQRHRLKARLNLLSVAPVRLTSLKKQLERLEDSSKSAIATFAATMVQANGEVRPSEVKMLEKIYKLLGVDVQQLYSDVHIAATNPWSGTKPSKKPEGFVLDPSKIHALQQDTAKVSALLAGIFTESDQVAEADILEDEDSEQESEPSFAQVFDLDEAHSTFARTLISRPSWTREQLQEIALELDLMLDGALERLSEASLDAVDAPFTEGDDPIEINPEITEKLQS